MIVGLIREIEESISSSSIIISSNIKKYFSSSAKEAYIKGTLAFVDLSSLEFSTYVIEKHKRLIFDKYRYQYMDFKRRLIFRYDNAAHHKNIATFPFHKHHSNGRVMESIMPKFHEVLEEITAFIAHSTAG